MEETPVFDTKTPVFDTKTPVFDTKTPIKGKGNKKEIKKEKTKKKKISKKNHYRLFFKPLYSFLKSIVMIFKKYCDDFRIICS